MNGGSLSPTSTVRKIVLSNVTVQKDKERKTRNEAGSPEQLGNHPSIFRWEEGRERTLFGEIVWYVIASLKKENPYFIKKQFLRKLRKKEALTNLGHQKINML